MLCLPSLLFFLFIQIAQRLHVVHADILSTDEVQRYKSLGVYINFIERPMLPSAWLAEMFNIASRKTEDAIRKLETEFEDVVTFRGHPYLRLMEQQYAATQKKGPAGLAPVAYVGNPFLRRTGTLLVNP